MNRELIEQKTEALLQPILASNEFELVDLEFVKERGDRFLRIYIDKPGGIRIDDCELVSRALSDRLDEEDFIEDAYILEVSSPGLLRAFKKDRDFERNLGEEVELRLFQPENGGKEFIGVLLAYDKDGITVETEEKALRFSRKNIALIRKYIDFSDL